MNKKCSRTGGSKSDPKFQKISASTSLLKSLLNFAFFCHFWSIWLQWVILVVLGGTPRWQLFGLFGKTTNPKPRKAQNLEPASQKGPKPRTLIPKGAKTSNPNPRKAPKPRTLIPERPKTLNPNPRKAQNLEP